MTDAEAQELFDGVEKRKDGQIQTGARFLEGDLNLMAKEPLVVTGSDLVDALEKVCAIMKEEIARNPELAYEVAAGGLTISPSIAVVIHFDPQTMKPKTTDICSEKRAAKAWNTANGIRIR